MVLPNDIGYRLGAQLRAAAAAAARLSEMFLFLAKKVLHSYALYRTPGIGTLRTIVRGFFFIVFFLFIYFDFFA